jgi:hypothetical protein
LQLLHSTLYVALNSRDGDAKQVGYFMKFPAEPDHQSYRHPLMLGQHGKRHRQTRLNIRDPVCRQRRQDGGRTTDSPRLAASYPVEVSGRVVHEGELIPVLPGIGERFSGGVGTVRIAIPRREGVSKPWLYFATELLKRRLCPQQGELSLLLLLEPRMGRIYDSEFEELSEMEELVQRIVRRVVEWT